MRLFGLIGHPLSHSFSKKYFTEKFDKLGLADCRYDLFPLSAIDELPALLASNPELEGLNVTIPYKKEVLQFLDGAALPAGLQACNCIQIEKGRLTGYNTDAAGFEKSMRPLLKPWHTQALVLGNGGAAEAVLYVLKKLGISFEVVSRSLHKGSTLTYDQLNKAILEKSTVIVNTTPLGMYPKVEACPEIPYEFLSDQHLLYDLVYNPAETLFLQKGKQKGATIKNGEEMLVLQAEESWTIWNS